VYQTKRLSFVNTFFRIPDIVRRSSCMKILILV
jgi:hypothetical protein